MSNKRRADTELNKDNWDEEDEPEEKGTFQVASADVLKNRIIKVAKRRVTNGAPDSEHSSIFTGFTGFGKKSEETKTAFSFVSEMKGVDTVNTVIDSSKQSTFSSSFGSSLNAGDPAKPLFSLSSSTPSIPSATSSKSAQSSLLFKCDSKKTDANENSNNTNKLNTLSNKLKTVVSGEQTVQKQNTESTNDDVAKTPDEIFLKKLRSLNLLCAEWIIKHLNENLSYILTPIFDDYKKHLTQLREERRLANSTNKKARIEFSETKVPSNEATNSQTVAETNSKDNFTEPKINFGIGSFLSNKEKDTLEVRKLTPTSNTKETTGFKFFDKEKKNEDVQIKPLGFSATDTPKFDGGLFKFNAGSGTSDLKSTNGDTKPTSAPFFSFKPTATTTTNSFFGASLAPKPEETTENEVNGPPPAEDVDVKEEGSVYDKKCKIFIKKDGNFIDHGIGFLFIKLVGDEQKCQVIVRANNKLANVIINVLLTSSIPVQKMGKNNVMIICCPTPETKQPTSVLIKVKTSDDAEEVLNNLNKYRK